MFSCLLSLLFSFNLVHVDYGVLTQKRSITSFLLYFSYFHFCPKDKNKAHIRDTNSISLSQTCWWYSSILSHNDTCFSLFTNSGIKNSSIPKFQSCSCSSLSLPSFLFPLTWFILLCIRRILLITQKLKFTLSPYIKTFIMSLASHIYHMSTCTYYFIHCFNPPSHKLQSTCINGLT